MGVNDDICPSCWNKYYAPTTAHRALRRNDE
jgi:hypothetical protein